MAPERWPRLNTANPPRVKGTQVDGRYVMQPQELLEKRGAANLLLRIGMSGKLILWVYERVERTKDRIRLVKAHLTGRRRKIIRLNDWEGDRYTIVAGFGARALPKSLQQIIPVLKKRGLKVILCHNGRLAPEAIDELKPHLHTIILRPNVGRDFGAYQDGIRFLQSLRTPPKRVLFVNDSIFFSPGGIEKLVADLDTDDHPYVGCSENFEWHYHVGSFLFSIGQEVFASKAFRAFWKQYFPFSTRYYSINCGEVRLTRYIKERGGFTPRILYSMHQAGRHVLNWSLEDLQLHLPLLPFLARDMVYGSELFRTYVDPMIVSVDGQKGQVRPARVSQELEAARDLALKHLLDQLVRRMEGGSQAHLACGVFVKYLGMPFLKKDMAYRELYSATDVVRLAINAGHTDIDDINIELRKRSYPPTHSRYRRLLYAAGAI
jgi:hypothetical protein